MDRWDEGSGYDLFMGRWSRRLASEFASTLTTEPGWRILDVGCGTGALLEAVRARQRPAVLVGVDRSAEFVNAARSRLGEDVEVRVADGADLPFENDSFDITMSGLVLNFIPDPVLALREWKRVTRPGGQVHAYVWDYAEGMEYLRRFWDAAVALKPEARDLDEGVRFPLCHPKRLIEAFEHAGLSGPAAGSLHIATEFSDFNDFWDPLLRGQGPAPGYVAALSDEDRTRLKDYLETKIPQADDGSISLTARAWTVSATV